MNSLEEHWSKERKQIAKLQSEGHTYLCARMMVFLDGECECEMKKKRPPAISQGGC